MFSGGLVFRRVAKHACTAVLLTRGAPNAMANHAMKLALSVQSCAAMRCTAWRRSTTPQCCFMAPVRRQCPAGRPRTCIDATSCARSVHCEIRRRPAGSTSWVPALHAAGRQHTHTNDAQCTRSPWQQHCALARQCGLTTGAAHLPVHPTWTRHCDGNLPNAHAELQPCMLPRKCTCQRFVMHSHNTLQWANSGEATGHASCRCRHSRNTQM